jgi:hypothetical protein
MGSDVDAVVAALKIALEEAQGSTAAHWGAKAANRWVARLPGAWLGRWRQLRIEPNYWGQVDREEFIGHVRAVLAYLETNREVASRTFAWRRQRTVTQAIPAEQKPTSRGSRLVH